MYNEKRKNEFISYYGTNKNSKRVITQIFEAIDPYESILNNDISVQSTKYVEKVAKELFKSNRGISPKIFINILNDYLDWCCDNGYEINENIRNIKIDEYEKIRSSMITSPLHLRIAMDRIDDNDIYRFDPPEKDTVDIVCRVYLWMAFAGMYESDAVRVTSDCIDLSKWQIIFEGRIYDIYKEGREDFAKACTLSGFRYEHKGYSETPIMKRPEGNLIMRGIRSSSVNTTTIRSKVNKRMSPKINDEDDMTEYEKKYFPKVRLSYNRVRQSGIFYRMYERERAGLPVDFSEIALLDISQREKEGVEYKVGGGRTRASIKNYNVFLYKNSYEQWKAAFAV